MFLRRRYVLPLLLILAWAGCRNCRMLKLRMNDREISETLSSVNHPYRITRTKVLDREIRYLTVGADSLPPLICLHGSPSSLSAWRALYTDTAFLNHYKVVAVDRPGYGYSNFGDVVTSLQQQVALLQPIVDSLTRNRKAVLLGSSYGGPVAAQLAMNLPHRFSQLVLMSASLIPGREKTYWVSYPMTAPLLEYLFPPTFVMSSKEKLSHRQELKTLEHWDSIRTDVVFMHGNKDNLIYYDNAMQAMPLLRKARSVRLVTMDGLGHSVIFSKPDYIKNALLAVLPHHGP